MALTVYSVPSQLVGERLKIHLYDDRLEAWLGGDYLFTYSRVRAEAGKRRARSIDYRHMISNLKKKPMAFYRSQPFDRLRAGTATTCCPAPTTAPCGSTSTHTWRRARPAN